MLVAAAATADVAVDSGQARDRLHVVILARLPLADSFFEELHEFDVNFGGETFYAHCPLQGVFQSLRLLIYMGILLGNIMFHLLHLGAHLLDSLQFVLCGGVGNAGEDLDDSHVLLADVLDLQRESLVLPCELNEVLALLDVLEAVDEAGGDHVDPLHEILAHLDQALANVQLPRLHQLSAVVQPLQHLRRVELDLLELLHLLGEALVNVDEVLLLDEALKALVLALLVRVEYGGGLVRLAADVQDRVRQPHLRISQERVLVHERLLIVAQLVVIGGSHYYYDILQIIILKWDYFILRNLLFSLLLLINC